MNLKRFFAVAVALVFSVAFAARLGAQSLIAGDIVGVVTDPSGAVVANTTVIATGEETGSVATTTTTASGSFRFSLLKPGRYTLTVTATGFSKFEQPVTVVVGQATIANVSLSMQKGNATVEVSATATPIITDNASINTTFTPTEIEQLPNGGSDITAIAETAPGVVLNSSGGYGNFTVNGQPATSNLFTVNGENDMDPYFNISNSGATNLLLGANEIQEATVTSNAYSGEYGQLSGAQISYVTKSGTNQFHGNAIYSWNGRALNANDWFANDSGSPRPFSNANQWAASIGGPIIKNKTFFFLDTEGLRFVLPNVDGIETPTPAFQTAMLANLATTNPNEIPAYTSMFNLYNAAATPYVVTPVPVGAVGTDPCASVSLPGFAAGTTPCWQTFTATPTAFASEWILSGRVDQRIGANDNLFFRYRSDHGTQPTSIDPINSNFDAISKQPSWDAQVNEVHTFGSNKTNAFTASVSHYVAQFTQSQPLASNTFPYAVVVGASSDVPISGFNSMYAFPQGRNVTQYQFIDDFTWTRGKHNFKFGENFRRYDVSDHNFFFNYPAAYFGYTQTLQEFADGLAYQYRQTDNQSSNVPVALWGIGGYAQDEWSVKSNLKVTLGLRLEHNSNPVCQTNCFDDFVSPFTQLPSYTSADPGSVPYNQDIATGLHQAFPKTDKINLSPRIGFSWAVKPTLVVSGGFGIFYDNAPAGLVDDLLGNPPSAVSLRVRPAGGTPAFDPTPTGSAATYQESASAFNSGFSSGQTYTQINNTLAGLGVVFAPPAFTSFQGNIHSPMTFEYNLQIQKQIGQSMAIVASYVGNHSERYPYSNAWPNANDGNYDLYGGLVPFNSAVPNYGTVTTVQSGANSGYNGLNLTFKKNMSHGLTFHLNYTYSHTIDEVSNGGVFTYGSAVPLGQLCPGSLKECNYGNADYDIRHNFNGDYVYNPQLHFENKIANLALGGWQYAGKIFLRSSLPYSIVDDNWNGAIANGGGTILAQPLGGSVYSGSCGKRNATANPGNPDTPSCLNSAAFVQSASSSFTGYTAFSNQGRNQYRGPGFFDMDMSLFKTFPIGERFKLGVGATAYNVFNHPNFGAPDAGFGDLNFGQISSIVGVPTSPYGNFLGFDSAPRLVQLQAKLTF